jgi:hypothetical protein
MLPSRQQLIILLLVFLSTIVLAETVERLETNPDYEDLNREEIFNSNKEWRLELPPEDKFRPAQPAEQGNSRRTLGVDYDYEVVKRLDRSIYESRQQEFGGSRPTSILRFNF